MTLIKPNEKKEFETCPPYTGLGICVDVTPPKMTKSQYGEKETIKFVFEVDAKRSDGERFAVWSRGFTLSLHEKAGLRKFLRSWRGHDLTAGEEAAGFDPESMLGRPCFMIVINTVEGDDTYANIEACTPVPSNMTALAASGKFVRAKDRQKNSSYSRAEGKSQEPEGPMDIKVHVGAMLGQDFKGLPPENIQKLIDKWKPSVLVLPKQTADDKRLLAALDAWQAQKVKAADDLPMDPGY